MKTQEEIEKLKIEIYMGIKESIGGDYGFFSEGFEFAYTQCQEDMVDKKYTEEDLHTILRLRKEWYSHTDKNVVRDFINSLNKQD